MRDVEPMLRRLVPERIVLRFEIDRAPRRVRADPAQIEQAVLNLAVNAKDAIAEGGRITFRVDGRTLSREEAAALPWQAEPGRYARLPSRTPAAASPKRSRTTSSSRSSPPSRSAWGPASGCR